MALKSTAPAEPVSEDSTSTSLTFTIDASVDWQCTEAKPASILVKAIKATIEGSKNISTFADLYDDDLRTSVEKVCRVCVLWFRA